MLISSISSPHRRMRQRYWWLSDDDDDIEDDNDDDMSAVGRCGVKSYFLFLPTCWATTWTETTVSWKREYSAVVQDTVKKHISEPHHDTWRYDLRSELALFWVIRHKQSACTITEGDLWRLSFHSASLVLRMQEIQQHSGTQTNF